MRQQYQKYSILRQILQIRNHAREFEYHRANITRTVRLTRATTGQFELAWLRNGQQYYQTSLIESASNVNILLKSGSIPTYQ